MENNRRIFLSRKNLGRVKKEEWIKALDDIGLSGINTDDFLDLESSDEFINRIDISTYSKLMYAYDDRKKFENQINQLILPKNVYFFSKESEYCGLLKISSKYILVYATSILEKSFFGGYFTIYSEKHDKIIEFDLEDNTFSLVVYQKMIS